MTLWSAEEAVAATGGRTALGWAASGVSIDTRSLQPGDLFVALTDMRDGHDFVSEALAKGACAALVSRVPDGLDEDASLLLVPDVLEALEALGRAARTRMQGKVIGVTGSVGKTSTKEMLRAALAGQGRVHAAEKSFNNHWGVPLTLARMPRDTDFAVIEIGMNAPGEIAPLAAMARPDVAIVTTVAPAHLEAFADVAAIAHEKAAIFDGMRPAGRAIINGDLTETPILGDAARNAELIIQAFGRAATCHWQLGDVDMCDMATVAKAQTPSGALIFKLAAPGRHFAMNALAALAAVEAAGGDLGRAVVALGSWHPPAGRGQRRFVALDAVDRAQGIDLIDDAYNANPASIAASLEVLASASPPWAPGRRVAILGDMKELGPQEGRLHAALADHVDGIDTVHCVGPLMAHLYEALPQGKRGFRADTAAELAAKPTRLAHAGDTVLVKGSLSMKMASIVDAIANLGQAVLTDDEDAP